MTIASPIENGRAHKKPHVDEIPREDASEDALLGSLLLDAAQCEPAFRQVAERDLFSPENQRLYRAIRQVYETMGTTDTTLIRNALAEVGDLGRIGRSETPESGVARLIELVSSRPTADHAPFYAECIAKAAARRRLLVRSDRLRDLATNPDGRNLEQLKADALAIVDDAVDAGRSRPTFNVIRANELATQDYDVEFVIPGLLAARQPCMVIGAAKGGKTSIAGCDLGVSLAAGGHVLGYFKVPVAKRVLLMSGESGLGVIRETCLRVCDAAGLRLEELDNFTVTDTLVRLSDSRNVNELRKLLTDLGTEVWILDPLYLSLDTDGSEGSIFAMGKMLKVITEVCQDSITPVVLHHTKKNLVNPHAPGELGDAAWSVEQYFRQWWNISRREKYEIGSGCHRLWFAVGGSAGHGGLWGLDINEGTRQNGAERFWDVSVLKPDEIDAATTDKREEAAEHRQREKLAGIKQKLVRAMAKHPAGETKSVIRDLAGVSGTLANAAFAELIESGDAELCQLTKGNRRSPVTGYRLSEGVQP